MKTHDYLVALATAAFSYLFFEQQGGINFLLFNILFLGITLQRDVALIRDRNWLWAASMCIISATAVLINSGPLPIFSNIVSLLLVSAFAFRRQSSAAFSFLFSCYSIMIAPVAIISSFIKPAGEPENRSSVVLYRVVGAMIVLALLIVFLSLYRVANPLFAVNMEWLNLEFINFPWLAFTVAGFVIVYGLYHQQTISLVENWEHSLSPHNLPDSTGASLKLDTEKISGVALFALLNVMLLVLNAGDISTLWMGIRLPEGMSHSDFVHQGVETTILSILIAAGLMMFLFRKNFAAHRYNKLLKILVCLWIVQTFVMLISTASRNQMYILEFGLTHLRIGVYAWLLLAMIGLLLTAGKILLERSNWYLVTSNVNAWFSLLAISSLVNWDVLITRYNMNHRTVTGVDYEYLFSLSDSNIPELIGVTELKEFPEINRSMLNPDNGEDFTGKLKKKITRYQQQQVSDWQSWNLADQRIKEQVARYEASAAP